MPSSTNSKRWAVLPTNTFRTATKRGRCCPGSHERFGARLHAPVIELLEIGQHAHVDVPLGSRHVDPNGIEVIPTPGHSPGSTCYLVPGVTGQTYLFTGDTIMLGADGGWVAGYIPPISDAAPLADSLQVLADLEARPGDLQRVPR